MSTLRISNIEAKSVPASATIDEKVKITNSSGDVLVFLDGKTSGITTVGINTTDGNITFDANSNIVVTGIITATKFVGTIEPTNLTVGGDLTITDKIIHSGDTNTAIRFPSADTITAETGGTERLRINSSGQLIMTNATTQTFFDFSTTNNNTRGLFSIAGKDSSGNAVTVKIGGFGDTNRGEIFTHSNHGLGFATNNAATQMILDTSGRLLLGTTTEGFATYGDQFTIANSGHCGMTIRSGTSNYGTIYFSDGDDGSADEVRGFIDYNHSNNQLQIGTNAATRLRIDSSGNVTKPTNFHILVDRSSNQTGYSATFPGDVIAWNRIQTGQSSTGASNHFNTSTGIFTAPVTGLYHFHASVNCNFNCEGGWIVVNGSRPNFANFYPNGALSADAMITYKVTAGHTVGVKWYYNCITNGTINSNALHTWWRIVLLG